jgi:hypothetical protein
MNKKISYAILAIILWVIIIMCITSCTENKRARTFGGNSTITLPPGQRLINATWKESNIWYLTEPMSSDYRPTTKIFSESSSFGAWEGTVTFIETK